MLKLLKHKKEKTMENYEVKGVSQASEIKKAYEEAIKSNAPKYRAISKTNAIYGWDATANKFIKAQGGQEWFDNPHYVAPVEEIVEEPIEVVEEKVEEVIEPIEEKEPEVDYKALYEEKCAELEEIKNSYENAKQVANCYKQENEAIKDGLSAFKALLNRV